MKWSKWFVKTYGAEIGHKISVVQTGVASVRSEVNPEDLMPPVLPGIKYTERDINNHRHTVFGARNKRLEEDMVSNVKLYHRLWPTFDMDTTSTIENMAAFRQARNDHDGDAIAMMAFQSMSAGVWMECEKLKLWAQAEAKRRHDMLEQGPTETISQFYNRFTNGKLELEMMKVPMGKETEASKKLEALIYLQRLDRIQNSGFYMHIYNTCSSDGAIPVDVQSMHNKACMYMSKLEGPVAAAKAPTSGEDAFLTNQPPREKSLDEERALRIKLSKEKVKLEARVKALESSISGAKKGKKEEIADSDPPPKGACWICGDPDHQKRDCPDKDKRRKRRHHHL